MAPVFSLWDGISMLSMSRLQGFLIGLILLYAAWRGVHAGLSHARTKSPGRRSLWLRELGILALSSALFAGFVIIGALWHRPMRSLAGVPPGDLVVDFHSHTNVSHDVRSTLMRGFDREANRRWHGRAGFDAAFITDHNIVSHESRVTSHEPRGAAGVTILCPGIEVSAWRAHIVLLGDTLPVDETRFNGSLAALLTLLQVSDTAYGSLSVASLPEYRRNHWGRLDTLIAAGVDGFEIVNAAPKANELTRAKRDSVIALARAGNRFVTGVSDSHGWGATSMVWNLVRGTGAGSARQVCDGLLRQLKTGFPAVQIIERHRLRPDDWWPAWLTPIGMVWETWRSMGWPLTLSWLAWIWLWPLLRAGRRRFLLRTDSAGDKIA